MTKQPEQILENNLIEQLADLGYKKVILKDEKELLANLKAQLEKHNKTKLSNTEFAQVTNHLSKGNVFEKAKTLRDKVQYTKDNGETGYLEFINQIHWCQNEFQVAQQITQEGSYKTRYDVTLLINGLPLVQIELKRRGLELKEAFNQINRYHRHSFWANTGLFQYVQLFVISNGVNTKYYANNKKQSFKQTFFWSEQNNKIISQLKDFANVFLEPCHVSKMITKYVVLNEAQKALMVLRPYQYYATEAIVERVKNSTKNGYIWHTTGSGKTLTSFKASQLLTQLPNVDKVIFVVDRKDLDYQTTKEFNSFSKGSIDGTGNTNNLVKQLEDHTKLIVTTIQKLNTAISKQRYLNRIKHLKEERIVFIFDECHRSQFGETHNRIKAFFEGAQMFGFTGTPIFAENAVSNALGKRTTKELFEDCLHKYVITDAIRDGNVLRFSIEYIQTFKQKEHIQDLQVEDIDDAEVLNAPERLEAVTDYIIKNHARKTHNKTFTGMFCTSSVDSLIKYYDLFQQKKEQGAHSLKIATIFSYQANEEDKDANGYMQDPEFLQAAEPDAEYQNEHSRDSLNRFISDYNGMYGTNYSTKNSQDFYNYYNDIAKRVKNKQVDILLVVNMFLTGFDSKPLNTLYVDKNLKYHGLIQAFSRTNRILDTVKSQGNIVCFRNLKQATDDAIALFSNPNAKDEIILAPYEDYIETFKEALKNLIKVAPSVSSVDELKDEEEELEFIKMFRALMRIKNVLSTFTEFSYEDVDMEEQLFEDYKSKYLDLYEKTKSTPSKEKVSILNDVDFELELIHRDEINVAYILKLLANIKDAPASEKESKTKAIKEILSSETQLRSKRELIEKFIQEHLPLIEDTEMIESEFDDFWSKEKVKAISSISKEENLDPEQLQNVIGDFLFTEKKPLRDDVINMMNKRPKLKERATVAERITNKITEFVETFISGIAS